MERAVPAGKVTDVPAPLTLQPGSKISVQIKAYGKLPASFNFAFISNSANYLQNPARALFPTEHPHVKAAFGEKSHFVLNGRIDRHGILP